MVTLIMMAGNVTPEQARRQAAEFMKNHLTTGGHNRAAAKPIQMTLQGQIEGLYLFNLEENNGFVIVSNDDRTDAILGFSDSGSLDPENMPDNMRAWLQGYADQIKWMDEHGVTAKASRRAPVKEGITPFVVTTWNQEAPYNNSCPDFFTYGKSATGCVATAMAQVMYYTAHTKGGQPSSITTTEIPAYVCSTNWIGLGQISVGKVDAGTELKWSLMKNSYESDDVSEAAGAVATLMSACGASVGMDYAQGSSSASSSAVPNALKTYFGYDATTSYYLRSNYSYEEWIEIIYHELSHQRPVLYDGSSTGGGHAFVCDGYQYEDFFHINWGWGGTSDGFFKLALCDPDQQGVGGSTTNGSFHFDQGITIGIQLNGAGGTVSDIVSTSKTFNLEATSFTFSPASGVAKVGQPVTCTVTVKNNGTTTYDGDITLYDYSSGKRLNASNMVIAPGETKTTTIQFVPTEAKTYRMYIITQTFYISSPTDFVVINGYPDTDNITLGRSLTVECSENQSGDNYYVYGNTLKGTLTVTNPNASYNYKGTYQIDIYLVSPWSLQFRYNSVITVPAGGSLDIPFELTGLVNGKQYVVDVNYIKNEAWAGWDQIAYYTAQPGIVVCHSDGTKTISKPSGTTYVTPSTALSVDLYGAGITTLTKNSNPNCLYIFKGGSLYPDAIPDNLTENVITLDGSTYTAAKIVLTDGYDFASPVDFTATSIEFTFNNDRWADGTKGWNTIMLPFNVSQVTAGGTDIDWFRNGTDHNKQFWLKEFVSDGAGTVSFDHASTMKANTPYIIALPGDHWGAAYDLSGKIIKFIGSGQINKSEQAVTTGSNYRFIGNTKSVTTANIYCINDEGKKFELKTSGGSPAFRPFFKAEMFDRSVGSLSIGSGGGTTGITLPELPKDFQSDKIFDLNGRQLTKPAKGIVIQNGRKVVKK